MASAAARGDNMVAMESRITTNDMLGQTGSAPNYGMLGYRNMMLAKQAQQQQTLGQSRPRGSQGGLGQNSFSQRSGCVAGMADTAANQIPAYTDYQDYGGVGASGVGAYGTANRRNQGFSGYGNYGNYGNVNRGMGYSSPRSLGGLGASGFGNYGAGNVGLGRNSGYGGSGPSGYSAINVVSGYGPGVCEDRGLNPILVLATLAGAGLAFFIIFRQVTGGGKRTIDPTVNEFLEHISNLFWSGKWSLVLSFLSP